MANGGIIGTVNIPTSTTATGVWQQEEQYEAKVTDTWPQRALFTTKSARFNDGSSDYLNRTSSSTGNKKTFTISYWCKRGNLTLGNTSTALSSGNFSNGDNHTYVGFQLNTDTARIQNTVSGSTVMSLISTALYRDVSAWYHFVWKVDTTQSTESDRVKLYVNGVEQTISGTYPTQNQDTFFGSDDTYRVGVRFLASATYWDGYLAEVCYVDGQALAPTSFGVANSDGVWTPIIYTGTFGTNGFNLQFENAAALGTDSSPNGNTFTVNNLTSIDQSTDYPVVNYATLNPLSQGSGITLSNGNCSYLTTGTWESTPSTIAMSSGKFYCEFKWSPSSTGAQYMQVGVAQPSTTSSWINQYPGYTSSGYGYAWNGDKYNNASSSSYGSAWGVDSIIGVAIDMDNKKLYFHKDGTYQNSGNPTSGATGTGALSLTGDEYYFVCSGFKNSENATINANFGSPPFAISSGNTDGNGYGNFEHAVPSGYYALNTANLAEFG